MSGVKDNEEGFTLIELIITIIVVGILAAVGVLIFANQQKAATDATLQSDLNNALIAMQTESTKNKGWFPSYLPLDAAASKGNVVTLVDNASNSFSDPTFQDGISGWFGATPAPEGSTPPRGNAILVDKRDHKLETDVINVSPGDLVEITLTARQTAGTLSLQAGIWQNSRTHWYCAPYLIFPQISKPENIIEEFSDGWATYRHVITVPSEYRNGGGVCPDTTVPNSITVAPFLQIQQGNNGPIPHGTNAWEVSNLIYRNLTKISNENTAAVPGGGTTRVLQQICIEAYNEGERSKVWSITNMDGVPREESC